MKTLESVVGSKVYIHCKNFWIFVIFPSGVPGQHSYFTNKETNVDR